MNSRSMSEINWRIPQFPNIYNCFKSNATHQNGKASKEVIDEHNTADQVRDLQRGLDWFGAIDGWAALSLRIFYHNSGHVELVLVSTLACLHGERLEESNADANDSHCYTAADQEQEADAEA